MSAESVCEGEREAQRERDRERESERESEREEEKDLLIPTFPECPPHQKKKDADAGCREESDQFQCPPTTQSVNTRIGQPTTSQNKRTFLSVAGVGLTEHSISVRGVKLTEQT